ncbi:hypothetical protein [Micromonospora sp. DT31]|uniref:hypothetical protein n=1 Tax=Micromonospora sp. DT31 TaxID=3393434 RepID=UPI003CEF31DA
MRPVRRALELLFTRVLRSRLGIALVIAVVVIGVIGGTRLVSGPGDSGLGLTARPSQPVGTVDPEAGDDGVLASPPTAAAPRIRPGEATPEQVAGRFATAWLTGPGSTGAAWQSRLRPLSTAALAEKMTGADPETVPARRTTGPPTLRPRTESFVEVMVPLDNGTLRLELVAPDGPWLVDAVDWERP